MKDYDSREVSEELMNDFHLSEGIRKAIEKKLQHAYSMGRYETIDEGAERFVTYVLEKGILLGDQEFQNNDVVVKINAELLPKEYVRRAFSK